MTNGRIGLGIVGLSAHRGWAASSHLPALAVLPQYELRALSASSMESAAVAAAKYGAPIACASAEELAARPEVDLVVVSVKVTEHKRAVDAALDAGKHVLCEWPLGKNLREAEEMASKAKARGVRGFVGVQARFQPAMLYLRDLIAEGYVGEVLSTSVIASGPIATAGPDGVLRASQGSLYYLDRANGGGMIDIPFGHTIDGLCQLFGELGEIRPTLAVRRSTAVVTETGETAPVTNFDQLALSGVFANGAVASIHYRAGIAPTGTGLYWEINGTKGTLVVTGPMGHLQLVPLTLRGASGAEAALGELPVPAKYFPAPDMPTGAQAVAGLYAAVAADLQGGTHTAATFDDAVARHRMIARIVEAAGA